MRGVGRSLRSRSMLADRTRSRALLMLVSIVVLVWGTARIASVGIASLGAVTEVQALGAPAVPDTNPAATATAHVDSRARLRNDLFQIPQSRKVVEKKEPRTNPVELLALVELQGILGGERPRAMVSYKLSQETLTVSVGDDLGEFEVMEIRERSVVLKWRDELFELSL